jgi:hypothetical protein
LKDENMGTSEAMAKIEDYLNNAMDYKDFS